MARCKNDFLCSLIFVVLKLVRTVSSPWGVGESGWRREKLLFSSCISSASFSVYLFFTVQQSPSLFCIPQAGVMQCFLAQCGRGGWGWGWGWVGWGALCDFQTKKHAFFSVENLCHFKEETLVTQIVGVGCLVSPLFSCADQFNWLKPKECLINLINLSV